MSEALLVARRLTRTFPQGAGRLDVLKNIDLTIEKGDGVCVRGSSGAGKSTLLQILGTLDRPTSGDLYYRNESLLKKSDDQLAEFRNKKMGFVFQFHHLMTEFTALENVAMPCRISSLGKKEAEMRASALLEELGLKDRLRHYPTELSGGEQQRVAIARALVQEPEILFADEPTGNLDTQNSQVIQQLFFDLKDRRGLTLVVVSHDVEFAKKFPRVLSMVDGQWKV